MKTDRHDFEKRFRSASNVIKGLVEIESLISLPGVRSDISGDKLPLVSDYYLGRKGERLKKEEKSDGDIGVACEDGDEPENVIGEELQELFVKSIEWRDRIEETLKNKDGEMDLPGDVDLVFEIMADRYNVVSKLLYGRAIRDVYVKAKEGDEEALFDLVRIDKTVLYRDWVTELVKEKQYWGKWEFLRKLGESLSAEPVGKDLTDVRLAMLTMLFWHTDLKDMRYREMRQLFVEEGLIAAEMDELAFEKRLNRWGFRKYSKVRQSRKRMS